jgi:DNA mismatch repair protein MutS
MEKLTPMMKQYHEVKEKYQDALVMFRLGDFYELFFEDAKIASLELDLVLTGRAAGESGRAPMCGVPYHAVGPYIQRLVDNGHKVAIVEQMEDPAMAVGLVRRDVVKVVTPGTILDEVTDDKSTVRIASLSVYAGQMYLIYCEVAGGETKILGFEASFLMLRQLILRNNIKELVMPSDFPGNILLRLRDFGYSMISFCDDDSLNKDDEERLGDIIDPVKRSTYGRLLRYLESTQRRSLLHLKPVQDDNRHQILEMDYSTLQNLELVQALRSNSKSETLFRFLDTCHTAMGSRLLTTWIEQPLNVLSLITTRQDRISVLVKNILLRDTLASTLKGCYDLERLIAKSAFGSATPHDVLRLRRTLSAVPLLKEALYPFEIYRELTSIDACPDLLSTLESALSENPPAFLKDGNVIREGYNTELDDLRIIQHSGKQWILEFENQEKERTGIKNLKVGYNRVFGYYIEISKGNYGLMKEEFSYVRKQTLANAERYITPLLKEKEDAILHAEERALRLETRLFQELIVSVNLHIAKIQKIGTMISETDVLLALSERSQQAGYVRPSFHGGIALEIIEGRHPILEKHTKYISNSCRIIEDSPIQIITGPNMGGKSTYMRQVALIVIMAQMGCFVPAQKASLPLIDKIFTRMGASDDILQGQSTFMVEMIEANLALSNATRQSMVFFDEIGRGTSTYDGMALAQAIVEYIATIIGCKTLFSTHYHELTQLDQSLTQVKNLHVEVHEEGDDVHFLYRMKHGKADRSYGVNVARLAKIPEAVLDRAKHLLKDLESKRRIVQQSMEIVEMVTIPKHLQKIEEQLKQIDPDSTTPLEALRYLNEWKKLQK